MAAVVPPVFFSNTLLRLSTAARAALFNAINTLGLDLAPVVVEQPGIIALPLHGADASAGTTANGPSCIVPFACEVVLVHHSAMTAGGATGTMQIERAALATPTSFSSIQTAATDVKTDVTKEVAASIDDTKHTFAAGDRIRVSGTSGSGGALNTQRSTVYLRRL